MSDGSLDRLLVVQDLDTLITQLTHRRARAGRAGRVGRRSTSSWARWRPRRRPSWPAVMSWWPRRRTSRRRSPWPINAEPGIEQRMYAARGSSTRDLQAMDEEVRHLNQRRSELEDEELVAMVDQEPIDAALAALAAQEGADRREGGPSCGPRWRRGRPRSTVSWRWRGRQRASEAAQLPPALSERYETLRARLKGTGAARLVGHRCSGCHLELSPVEVDRIRAMSADTVVTCDQCGRILVPT